MTNAVSASNANVSKLAHINLTVKSVNENALIPYGVS